VAEILDNLAFQRPKRRSAKNKILQEKTLRQYPFKALYLFLFFMSRILEQFETDSIGKALDLSIPACRPRKLRSENSRLGYANRPDLRMKETS